ncbi:hypothetical protein Q765_18690 [Flavobacterium rivuli WB 3.3-2 = DSM 21788]|uniref:Uncharacterized protein n=1 Tax=Flavobacterium rivuli WB 3.3-2 = DSM 21788 TaxID=1121895 RepID=A0A0A2LYE7_9FLAO|nr:hypothetical protein [Flavobacterium rivuli]KGO85039.1 hypothetical protein Q765_18690 [Flavobacterium rivuli WB 3.3-2 = DSM 21788]
MKIVKYIFLLLILATIAVTVFIATQEGKYNIKKDKVIGVSRQVLYNYVNDYKNWENLGLFANADTTATFTFSGNPVGKGAFISWTKGSNNGKIQTLNTAANDSIGQKATIDDLNSNISWSFKDTLNSTRISVSLKGSLTFKEKAFALLNGGIDNKIESSLERGLDNLNTFLVKELQVYKVDVAGLVTKKGTFYLGQSATSPLADANQKASASFGKLTAFAKENNIIINGRPFILFKNGIADKENVTYWYCIPIRDEMFTSPGSDYEGGKLLPFNAVKTTLKGDYSHIPKVWEVTKRHINQKVLQENTTGQYIEVYAKGSDQTRRPSAWVTDVYTPIGTPTITVDSIAAISAAAVPLRSPANNAAKPTSATAKSGNAGNTTARPATQASKPGATGVTAPKPATPNSGTKPAVTSPKPTGNKPATTGSTSKPATGAPNTTKPSTATGTAKPSGNTGVKPVTTGNAATSKPASATTAKPGSATAGKPAATTKTATAKPRTTTAKKATGSDDLNPPREEK